MVREIVCAGCLLTALLLTGGVPVPDASAQNAPDSLRALEDIYRDLDEDGMADLLGERVTVRGTATVATGIYHERYLQIFIQNGTAGLSLFAETIDEEIDAGDVIRATGVVQEYFGLVEVNVSDYEVVEHRPPDSIRAFALDSVYADPRPYLGMEVEGEAVVVEKGHQFNGKYLSLASSDSARHTIRFYVTNFHSRYANFDFEKVSVGDEVSVAGVVSRYDPGEDGNYIYSVFPRTADDFDFAGVPRYYRLLVAAGLGGLLLVVVVWIVLLRRQVRSQTRKLSESLEEKEILLQEIHHRVKNNLAIISGLIDLQKDSTEDESARRVLEDSQNRIQAMALVHDKLYRSASLKEIGMEKYVTDLVEAIHRTFSEKAGHVELKFDVEDLALDLKNVIPCGLIINELAVNAYKHAFPAENGEGGVLRIGLERREGKAVLEVEDNGPGLPADFSMDSVDSLGMQLVKTFAEQLSAETEVDTGDSGTCFRFIFPPEGGTS